MPKVKSSPPEFEKTYREGLLLRLPTVLSMTQEFPSLPQCLTLYFYLLLRTNGDMVCKITNKEIMTDLRISIKQIVYFTSMLQAYGYLKIINVWKSEDGKFFENHYIMNDAYKMFADVDYRCGSLYGAAKDASSKLSRVVDELINITNDLNYYGSVEASGQVEKAKAPYEKV